MLPVFDSLRSFSFAAVLCRLGMAALCGGLLGISRTLKGRAAGFRTYMLVCMGACLTVLLGQYLSALLASPGWEELDISTDISRFGAQVINGIGFLGAGSVIVTGHHEVKGLTTAAGLWASACLGLAVGAGFYECVLLAFCLIFLTLRVLPLLETAILEHGRNINIYMEFLAVEDVREIIRRIHLLGGHIHDVDISHNSDSPLGWHSAYFSIRLNRDLPHSQVLAAISEFDHIVVINEV